MSGIIGESPNMKSGVLGKYPDGHILQVVTNSVTSSEGGGGTTPTVFTITGLNASITPSSTSNKIVIQTQSIQYTVNDNCHLYSTIYRGSSHLAPSNEGFALWTAGSSSSGRWNAVPMLHTDSPNTTSAVTYHIYFRVNTGEGWYNYLNNRASIILMEIAQ